MNRAEQQARHDEIRRNYRSLIAGGRKPSVVHNLSVIYGLTERRIRQIIKEDNDN